MKSFAIGAVTVIALLLLGWLYGIQQYHKGYQARHVVAELDAAEVLTKTRQMEQDLLTQLEQSYADAYEQNQRAQAAYTSLAADRDRLREFIRSQANPGKLTGTASGTDADASACWITLDESVGRYTEMAITADGYVEDLRVGQNWAKVVKQVGGATSP